VPEHVEVVDGVRVVGAAAEDQAVGLGILVRLFTGHDADALRNGAEIEFGWGPLRAEPRGDGSVVVMAPDYARDPSDWSADLTVPAMIVAEQSRVQLRTGTDRYSSRFDGKVVIAEGALEAPAVYLQRIEPRPNDTGWFVGYSSGGDNSRLVAVRPLDILRARPALVPFLGLPAGSLVVLDGDTVRAVLDADNQDIWKEDV